MKNSDLEILLEAETFADKVIKKIIDYSLKQPKSSRFVVNDVEIFIETGNNEFSAIYFPKEETVKAHIIICGFAIYRTFKNIKTKNREFFNKFPNAIFCPKVLKICFQTKQSPKDSLPKPLALF